MRPQRTSLSWFKRLLTWRLMLPINLLLIGFISWSLVQGRSQASEVDTQLSDLEKETRSLDSQNNDYTALISQFGTSSFVEREARLKLNYQKSGEHILVLQDPGAASATVAQEAVDTSGVAQSNPEKWWQYFVWD